MLVTPKRMQLCIRIGISTKNEKNSKFQFSTKNSLSNNPSKLIPSLSPQKTIILSENLLI